MANKYLGPQSPFRDGVCFWFYGKEPQVSFIVETVAEGQINVFPSSRNLGYFFTRVENVKQFELALSVLHRDLLNVRLSNCQLRRIFDQIDAAQSRMPLAIRQRDFDRQTLAKGFFFQDGVWRAHFVMIEGPRLVEHKYALDARNHIGHLQRVMVDVIEASLKECEFGNNVNIRDGWWQPVWTRNSYNVPDWVCECRRPVGTRKFVRREQRCASFIHGAADLPEMCASLANPDPFRRLYAARALGNIAGSSKAAVAELKNLVRDPDATIRLAATLALGEIGPAARDSVDGLTRALNDTDGRVRHAAADALGGIGVAAVAALRKAVEDGDDSRLAAVTALGEIGPPANAAIPELRVCLSDKTPSIRCFAAQALGEIGARAAPALGPLRMALGDEESAVRESAASALGQIGPAAKVAVPDLVRLVSDPALTHLISDEPTPVGDAAAKALTRIGERVANGVGDLRKLSVPHAFWTLSPEVSAFPSEAEAMRDAAYRMDRRKIQMYLLRRVGPADVPEVRAKLRDPDRAWRDMAATVLGCIGPDAKAASHDLETAVSDQDEDVRFSAAWALGWVDPDPKTAVPCLRKVLGDSGRHVRMAAADSLGRIGPVASSAVAELRKALDDKDSDVRTAAVTALGRIGPAAKAAVPDLKAIISNDVWPITDVAEDALDAIRR